MIVQYDAVDRAGQQVTDTLEAPDVRSAVELLRKRDLFVTSISKEPEGSRAVAATPTRDDLRKVHLTIKQLTMLTRQMAMLLTSGSGLVPALNSISRQFTHPRQVKMIRQLCYDLEEGSTLSDALRKYPRVFSSSYCAIIAAGEASGALVEMFTRLAEVVGNRRAMHSKVVGAMAYPVLLTTMSMSIMNVLLFFVMPRFGEMFKTLGVDLPASTAALISTAHFAHTNWLVCIVSGIALVAGGVFAFMSHRGRRACMTVLSHVPVVRKLMSGLIQAETFRVMGMLLESRVSVLESIDLVKGVTHHAEFQRLYADIQTEVTSGGSVSRALEASGIIAPYICHAVHTGEESGQLGGAMSYVAKILDEDNTELLNTLTKLMEPAILIVMGVVVGAVSISLFLPMFDVTAAVH